MFLSKSFSSALTTAILLSSGSTVLAQTVAGPLPNCTEAEVNATSAILSSIFGNYTACGQLTTTITSLETAQAVCSNPVCADAFENIWAHELPPTECVQYVPANTQNISNYQQIAGNAFNPNVLGLENSCAGAMTGKPSCKAGGAHPEVSHRDLELLGIACYSDLMENNSTGCFSSDCTSVGGYIGDSQWPICTFGYYSKLEGSAQLLATTCAAVKAGECSAANLTSFTTVLSTGLEAANETLCGTTGWVTSLLSSTEGTNCTYMGVPLLESSWVETVSMSQCSCSTEEVEEYTTLTSSLLSGNYTTCLAEVAASPETACDSSSVCESVMESLENVTVPDCEIDGTLAKDHNMTTAITEALKALDMACEASSASTLFPVTNAAVTGFVVSLLMMLFSH